MSRFKTPAERAADDAIKHGLLKPHWVEKRKRWMNSRDKWKEQTTIIPSGLEVNVIPYEEPITKNKSEQLSRDARIENKQNRRLAEPVGKAGERKHYNPKSTRSLTDEEAILCRRQCREISIRKLALYFDVSENCVLRCVKGYTYKHLNHIAKPIF